MFPRRRVLAGVVALACAAVAHAAAPPEAGFEALRGPAVVLLRHADAPGIGDPPAFRLGDCTTQRNLDAAGRAQARAIGAQFRAHGVQVGEVLASQWCRTHETAELAFPGRVRDDADFNSFFDDSGRESAQTARALETLGRWHGPGVLVVVTHQVNITALTGAVPASGEGIVVRPRPGGHTLDVVARVRPGNAGGSP